MPILLAVIFALLAYPLVSAKGEDFSTPFSRGRWRMSNHNLPEVAFSAIALSPEGKLYVASARNLYRMNETNRDFEGIAQLRGPRDSFIHNILFLHSPHPFLATSEGLFTTAGGDLRVVFQNIGEGRRQVNDLVSGDPLDNTLFLATAAGFFLSEDGGKTFKKSGGVVENSFIFDIEGDPNRGGWVALGTSQGLYESRDWGHTFQSIFKPVNGRSRSIYKVLGDPRKPGHLFLATSGGVYHNPNSDSTFLPLVVRGLPSSEIRDLAHHPSNPHLLTAATRKGFAFFDLDREGEGWRTVDFGLLTRDCRRLAPDLGGNTVHLTTPFGIYRWEPETLISGAIDPTQIAKFNRGRIPPTEILAESLKVAQLDDRLLRRMRHEVNQKNYFPKISMRYGRAGNGDEGISSSRTRLVSHDRQQEFFCGLFWNLSEIVFNSLQVTLQGETNKLIKAREQLLEKVQKLFFERERLALFEFLKPEEDPAKKLANHLLYLELTSRLDSLTGGFLTQREQHGAI